MPGYMKDALHKFQHPTPTIPQHLLHQWKAPNYGYTAPQLAHPTNNSLELNPDESINAQQVVGKFLYYARTVDPTMLVTLNSIAAEQSKNHQVIAEKVVKLLNYVVTHPEAITRYHASVMNLHIPRNVSFLSVPGANIISWGYHYVSAP